MAHYTKADKRALSAIRNSYATYLRNLCASGNREIVIQFCNSANVRWDVEAMLKRELTESEAVALLYCPEDNARFGEVFQRAHSVALNLKHARQLCRTVLREHRLKTTDTVPVEKIFSSLDLIAQLDELEAELA